MERWMQSISVFFLYGQCLKFSEVFVSFSWMCYVSAVTKSRRRSAHCHRRWGQRPLPIPARLRSVPTKRGKRKYKFGCFKFFCSTLDIFFFFLYLLFLFFCFGVNRTFTKLKECSNNSGRPNISRSSSSTSSFSSTTGETEALEELESVSTTLFLIRECKQNDLAFTSVSVVCKWLLGGPTGQHWRSCWYISLWMTIIRFFIIVNRFELNTYCLSKWESQCTDAVS